MELLKKVVMFSFFLILCSCGSDEMDLTPWELDEPLRTDVIETEPDIGDYDPGIPEEPDIGVPQLSIVEFSHEKLGSVDDYAPVVFGATEARLMTLVSENENCRLEGMKFSRSSDPELFSKGIESINFDGVNYDLENRGEGVYGFMFEDSKPVNKDYIYEIVSHIYGPGLEGKEFPEHVFYLVEPTLSEGCLLDRFVQDNFHGYLVNLGVSSWSNKHLTVTEGINRIGVFSFFKDESPNLSQETGEPLDIAILETCFLLELSNIGVTSIALFSNGNRVSRSLEINQDGEVCFDLSGLFDGLVVGPQDLEIELYAEVSINTDSSELSKVTISSVAYTSIDPGTSLLYFELPIELSILEVAQ